MTMPRVAGRVIVLAVAVLAGVTSLIGQSVADEPRSPRQTIDAFHAALRDEDPAQVLSLLAKDVIIFEMGLIDRGREAYAASHLQADIAGAKRYERELEYRNVSGTRDGLLVVSTYELRSREDADPVRRTSLETMLLRRVAGNWRIAHIHWSSVTRPGD